MVPPEIGVSDVVIQWGEIEVKTNKALVEGSKFSSRKRIDISLYATGSLRTYQKSRWKELYFMYNAFIKLLLADPCVSVVSYTIPRASPRHDRTG
jgi:hypothetical protein